jgi:hypothetical protein
MAPAGQPRGRRRPARLIKTGIVGDGHVRGFAAGDDGKSFKWIAFRMRDTGLGQALLSAAATAAGGWPERSSATSGTAAMRRKCTSRTRPCLTAAGALA